MSANSGAICILILLDLSAAFDIISHSILLDHIEKHIRNNWFKSDLSDHSQSILQSISQSDSVLVKRGVPQGSVLGPLLVCIYMLPFEHIIRKYGLELYCYADDIHIYISTKLTCLFPLWPFLPSWMTSKHGCCTIFQDSTAQKNR